MEKRFRILITGIVQGVGFRPFLYRTAQTTHLSGFVQNTSRGVILEVEGEAENIGVFLSHIHRNPPPLSRIEDVRAEEIELRFTNTFQIIPSEENGQGESMVSPDIALCENCRAELFDPGDRRYLYPFINCTDCGPRFSIIQALPYDRPKTTMKGFVKCPACETEYQRPADRRYHAQPISCYDCGPRLSIAGPGEMAITGDPLDYAGQQIDAGHIVAIKGLGGYHLACRALSSEAVLRLRELKGRESKPFALMGSLDMIRRHTHVSPAEEALLLSPAAPVVLLRKRAGSTISGAVAPGLADIGFMLPYTPVHLLILEKVAEPLVMTSANIAGEPIIYTDDFDQLRALSDCILTHDRDIRIFTDDSVVQVFSDRPYMVRRSRGFVPLPLKLPFHCQKTILALGPMLKTTFTFLFGNKAIIGQHIGDTDSPTAIEAEKKAIEHAMDLFSLKPDLLVIDKHPGYPNRELAAQFPGVRVVEIQHHQAHIGSLLAECGQTGTILGISLDGTGYGDDGQIWGGEFFIGDYRGLSRFGHLSYLFLPSGDKAAKEPWRFALSVLYTLYGRGEKTLAFAARFGKLGEQVLEVIVKRVGGIFTTSGGRIFDAAACLLGLGDVNHYEGELPARLQACAESFTGMGEERDNFSIEKTGSGYTLDLVSALRGIIEDGKDKEEKAYIFHLALAKGLAAMAGIARVEHGIDRVGLSGGVFQNTLLLKLTRDLLLKDGFEVLIHAEAPTNDGGISLGQAFLAAGILQKEAE